MREFRYIVGGLIFIFGMVLEVASVFVCAVAVCVGYGFREAKDYWNRNT